MKVYLIYAEDYDCKILLYACSSLEAANNKITALNKEQDNFNAANETTWQNDKFICYEMDLITE